MRLRSRRQRATISLADAFLRGVARGTRVVLATSILVACGPPARPAPPPPPVLAPSTAAPNTAPMLTVSGSAPSGTVTYGEIVALTAACVDREDGTIDAVRWTLEDGTPLRTGPALRFMPEPGRYRLLASCSDQSASATTVAATPRFEVVDRWTAADSVPVAVLLPFATNRGGAVSDTARGIAFNDEPRDSLVRGVLVVNVPARDFRAAGSATRTPFMRSVRGNFASIDAMQLAVRGVTALDSAAFVAQLAARQNDAPDTLPRLVFVHGYRTTFEGSVWRAARLAGEVQFAGATVLFAWPSDGLLSEYRNDQRDARAAGPRFAALLQELRAASSAPMSLVVHSMGAEVLAAALPTLVRGLRTRRGDALRDVILRDVVLVSPDLAAGDFLEQVLPALRQVAARVTIYAAAADVALWTSWGSNLERRVGLGGRFATLAPGVETVEVPYSATDMLGHNPFAAAAFRDDLHALLVEGRPASRRGLTAVTRDDGLQLWRLP